MTGYPASRRHRSLDAQPRAPWRPRPIRTSLLYFVFASIVLGGWWYYSLQANQIDAARIPGDPQAELEITKMRLDTIRNTLTVAAGLGGAAALILSFRRQQHEEYHSTQQRITELRIQAVAQLGSENATVRIGGLHNLERLGEQHDELRQIVLDEICSYLRLPYLPIQPAARDEDSADRGIAISEVQANRAEREVRLIAQEILQRHLNTATASRRYWSHARLNLRNAFLDGIDFSACRLNAADFHSATFSGPASFKETSFEGPVTFDESIFQGNADFARANFGDGASLAAVTFNQVANFEHTSFAMGLDFTTTVFKAFASFEYAAFIKGVAFRNTRFESHAEFSGAIFNRNASFTSSIFGKVTAFSSARFRKFADFENARFEGLVFFSDTVFDASTGFYKATFRMWSEPGELLEGWTMVPTLDDAARWQLVPDDAVPQVPSTSQVSHGDEDKEASSTG
ncbi:pentapeptide repeat-containing protein [Glycomyces rhizosphaerae]|uniref:Pentapeptide repeat-containing protein n=1 Tax=Glycomyces rhizosphaerae TaxID=2054422 RepID=A0ABV7PYA0_9ACTN